MEKHLIYAVLGAVILFTITFNLPLLAHGFPIGGDNVGHYDLIVNTVEVLKIMIKTGNLLLWDTDYYFGFPLFFYYAPLPYVFLAFLTLITGIDALLLFKLSIVLIFSLLPVLFYVASRFMELEQEFALGIAVFSTALSSITVFGLEYYAFFATGLFSQLFALLFFPFAFAFAYRVFVLQKKDRSLFFTVLFLSLSFTSHIIVGLIAAIAVGVLVCCALFFVSEKKQIIINAMIIFAFFFLSVSFLVVPYIINQEYFGNITFDLAHKENGYGIVRTINYLFTGDLLDYSAAHIRIPVITILFFIGLGVFLFWKPIREKYQILRLFVFVSLLFSLVCLAGKNSFGFIGLLPVFSTIQTFRFIFFFHFVSLFLIGAALCYGIHIISTYALFAKKHNVIILFILAIIVLPVFYERIQTMNEYSDTIDVTHDKWYADIIKNINAINAKGRTGRVYVPFSTDLIEMPQHLQAIPILTSSGIFVSTGIGGHDSIMSYYAGLPLRYEIIDLFAVDSIIGIENSTYRLYVSEDPATYFALVDVPFAIDTDAVHSRDVVITWLFSNAALQHQFLKIDSTDAYVVISSPENDPEFMTIDEEDKPFGNKLYGKIYYEKHSPLVSIQGEKMRTYDIFQEFAAKHAKKNCGTIEDGEASRGRYGARTTTTDDCYLIFKMSYHPEWHVAVDGKEQELVQLSPGFMGVLIPKGEHDILFSYRIFWYRPLLLFLGCIAMIILWFKKFHSGF